MNHPVVHQVPVADLIFPAETRVVQDLSDSVKEYGILNAIHITTDCRVIDGKKRVVACRLLGIETIPAIIRK